VTGFDVAEWVRSTRPDLKVLLTSGYADPPTAANDRGQKIRILRKPYTREQLAQTVRETLHGFGEGPAKGVRAANMPGEPSTVIQLRRAQRLR